jgi:hypothetical protein
MESMVRTEIRVPAEMVTDDEDCATSFFSMDEGTVGCLDGTEGEPSCASDSNRNERTSAMS